LLISNLNFFLKNLVSSYSKLQMGKWLSWRYG